LKEQKASYDKQYYEEHKQTKLKANHERSRLRMKTDPGYRMRIYATNRLRNALVYQGTVKSSTMTRLVGCTKAELMLHLEKQFLSGMSWENYGPTWHVDHIRPCASFNLVDPDEQKACFHFSNLQPLWGKENREKGATY
jgi:hypothetical protein